MDKVWELDCTLAASHGLWMHWCGSPSIPTPPAQTHPSNSPHPSASPHPLPPYAPPGAVIHPQSIIHSMVETADSSVLAQLGWPDMRLPILYTMSWPARVQCSEQTWPRLDFVKMGDLTFRRGRRQAAGGVLGGTGRPRVCHYTGRAIVWRLGPSLPLPLHVPATPPPQAARPCQVPVHEAGIRGGARRWHHDRRHERRQRAGGRAGASGRHGSAS